MAAMIRLMEWLSVRKRADDLESLRRLLGPLDGVRLLDVGGGAGAATERFAAGAREVVIVEPDPRKVALGRRRRPAFRFEAGHAERVPFPDAAFDRVTAVVAFHHMEDQDRALDEMRRALSPSGRIVLLEMPPSRAPGPFRRWLGGFRHAEHMAFLEPEDLRKKLDAHGFRGATVHPGATGYFVTASR